MMKTRLSGMNRRRSRQMGAGGDLCQVTAHEDAHVGAQKLPVLVTKQFAGGDVHLPDFHINPRSDDGIRYGCGEPAARDMVQRWRGPGAYLNSKMMHCNSTERNSRIALLTSERFQDRAANF